MTSSNNTGDDDDAFQSILDLYHSLDDTLPPNLLSTDNLCQAVRDSCQSYLQRHHRLVSICSDELHSLASQFPTDPSQIIWDAEGWHLQTQDRQALAHYILGVDAINFCFWPCASLEYAQLCTCLKDSFADWQTAIQLQEFTVTDMQRILPYPNINHATRCHLWNEVGQVLLEHFDGSAWKLVEASQGSLVKLVSLLVQYFPGFRDATTDLICLKRAQICAGDLRAALGTVWMQLQEKYDTTTTTDDLHQLTTFADYRVPQLLRDIGVLEYVPVLQAAVDAQHELAQHSRAEGCIRAATVVAVEQLTALLQQQNPDWTACQVDWYLWQIGEQKELAGELRPHHRVRTTFY